LAWPGPRVAGGEMEGKGSSCASPDLGVVLGIFQRCSARPRKPACFFVSWSSDKPQALRAMRRISMEMGESSMARGVAVFCVRRAVA